MELFGGAVKLRHQTIPIKSIESVWPSTHRPSSEFQLKFYLFVSCSLNLERELLFSIFVTLLHKYLNPLHCKGCHLDYLIEKYLSHKPFRQKTD